MIPGAHHQNVEGSGGTLFHFAVRFQSAEQIFSIEPATHCHHRRLDVGQVRTNVARLPEGIIVGMLGHVAPEWNSVFVHLFVDFGERAHTKKQVVAIGRSVIEYLQRGVVGLGMIFARVGPKPAERMSQIECSIVMEVIANEPICNGSLRGHGFQRGVRIDHTCGRVEAWIRDAIHANSSIVTFNILQQEVDRIARIGTLVHIFRPQFMGVVRTNLFKDAFGFETSTHILIDENVALFSEQFGGAERSAVLVNSVGLDAVGSARKHHRVGFGRIFGYVDGGE